MLPTQKIAEGAAAASFVDHLRTVFVNAMLTDAQCARVGPGIEPR